MVRMTVEELAKSRAQVSDDRLLEIYADLERSSYEPGPLDRDDIHVALIELWERRQA